jgi:hypothetical protein
MRVSTMARVRPGSSPIGSAAVVAIVADPIDPPAAAATGVGKVPAPGSHAPSDL